MQTFIPEKLAQMGSEESSLLSQDFEKEAGGPIGGVEVRGAIYPTQPRTITAVKTSP